MCLDYLDRFRFRKNDTTDEIIVIVIESLWNREAYKIYK